MILQNERDQRHLMAIWLVSPHNISPVVFFCDDVEIVCRNMREKKKAGKS